MQNANWIVIFVLDLWLEIQNQWRPAVDVKSKFDEENKNKNYGEKQIISTSLFTSETIMNYYNRYDTPRLLWVSNIRRCRRANQNYQPLSTISDGIRAVVKHIGCGNFWCKNVSYFRLWSAICRFNYAFVFFFASFVIFPSIFSSNSLLISRNPARKRGKGWKSVRTYDSNYNNNESNFVCEFIKNKQILLAECVANSWQNRMLIT